MIFGEGGSAAGRAAYRCRAAACAAAIAAGALLFPQPGQAAATTPHDTATAPQSAVTAQQQVDAPQSTVTAQQQVAAPQSAVAAPQQVAAQPAVDAGTSPDGGVAAAAGEGAGPAGKAPAVPMPGVSAPEPSARAETINAVLTASWETASIPDHQASNLKLHINRASAAMAVSGLAFTVTLPSGLTVADDVPTMGCTATPALTNGTATIAFSAVGLGIGVTDCDLVVAVAGISSGTYPLANGDVSGTSGVSANVAAQLQITPALPRIHGYFSPATIDPGDPSQLRLNLMRTDNNMTAGAGGLGFRITLPVGVAVVGVSGTNTCGGTLGAVAGTRVITLSGAALPAGPSDCSLTVVTTGNAGGAHAVLNSAVDSVAGVQPDLTACPVERAGRTEGGGCGAVLTVNKVAQTITFAQPADYAVTKRGLTFAATTSSGLAVAYTSTTPSVCTVSGAVVTLLTQGACTIAAGQDGNGDYLAAEPVSRTFTVGPPPPAPTGVSAQGGVSSAKVTWTAPADPTGVTGYTVTAEPGPATCSTTGATSCVVGATAGVTYTFTVVAEYARGDSAPVGPSNPVTPVTPPISAAPPVTDLVLTTDKGLITTAEPSQDIVVIGTGFAPHSTATIVIYSRPIELGTVITDGAGDFSKPVRVPASLAAGAHTLVAAGVDPSGRERNMKLAVRVRAHAGTLAVTGAPIQTMLLAGLAALLAGATLLGATRPRPPVARRILVR